MGIIQRQSVKFTLVNLIGTAVGFVSVIFIYPLLNDAYGYFQAIYSIALLLIPFLGLGLQSTVIKYFPAFQQKNAEQSFLSFTLLMSIGTILLGLAALLVLYHFLYPFFKASLKYFYLVENNLGLILSLAVVLYLGQLFSSHAMARLRIVVPDLLSVFLQKLFVPLMVLLIYWGYVKYESFGFYILAYFGVITLLLFLYVLFLAPHDIKPRFDILNKSEFKGMLSFMSFASLNNLGSSLALRLDTAMISVMLGADATQIYAIIIVISNVMEIPTKALNQISSPVISSNWANDDRQNISVVYQKSSIYGLVLGMFLFTVLMLLWPDIIDLMPNKLIDIDKLLIIFGLLGIARLTDLITGVNSNIIIYSKKYKVHMYFLLLLGGLNLIFNFVFISYLGLIGAALATALSYVIFNFSKHLYINKKFNITIDFKDQIKILLVGILILILLYQLPLKLSPYINIPIKVALASTLYLISIWIINPGDNLRDLILNYANQVKTLILKR